MRFSQRLSQILDVKPEEKAQVDRYDTEIEDAISNPLVSYPDTYEVKAATSISFETLTSTSIPVYISTPKVNPANPPAGSIVIYLDEVGNKLMFNVTYSDGVTTKSGTVALT